MLTEPPIKSINFTNGEYEYHMQYDEFDATLVIYAYDPEEHLTWKTKIVIPLGNSELSESSSDNFILDLTPFEVFKMFVEHNKNSEHMYHYVVHFPEKYESEKSDIRILIDIKLRLGVVRSITKCIILFPEEISIEARLQHKFNRFKKYTNEKFDHVDGQITYLNAINSSNSKLFLCMDDKIDNVVRNVDNNKEQVLKLSVSNDSKHAQLLDTISQLESSLQNHTMIAHNLISRVENMENKILLMITEFNREFEKIMERVGEEKCEKNDCVGPNSTLVL